VIRDEALALGSRTWTTETNTDSFLAYRLFAFRSQSSISIKGIMHIFAILSLFMASLAVSYASSIDDAMVSSSSYPKNGTGTFQVDATSMVRDAQ
jgi:hypothetical protein